MILKQSSLLKQNIFFQDLQPSSVLLVYFSGVAENEDAAKDGISTNLIYFDTVFLLIVIIFIIFICVLRIIFRPYVGKFLVWGLERQVLLALRKETKPLLEQCTRVGGIWSQHEKLLSCDIKSQSIEFLQITVNFHCVDENASSLLKVYHETFKNFTTMNLFVKIVNAGSC